MALESATYIDGLVSTNPVSGDPVSQADDHLRLLKSTVKATFPNLTGPVNATQAQLNHTVGVTSAIQTQIDAKLPASFFPNVNAAATITDEQLTAIAAAPAFSAYASVTTSVAHNTDTLVGFQTEEFDTAGAYNNVTYRFQPTTAGYYYINAQYAFTTVAANSTSVIRCSIFKNGVVLIQNDKPSSANVAIHADAQGLVYFNGSTDYVNVWALQNTGVALTIVASSGSTRFSAHFVRP